LTADPYPVRLSFHTRQTDGSAKGYTMDAKNRPERVLVSACLLGRDCTYDGSNNADRVLERELREARLEAVPFCPEEAGQLGTPRPPADLTAPATDVLDGAGRVVTHEGTDVTDSFRRGAEAALRTCQREGLERAFLKERSPSCGCSHTHQTGGVVRGPGLTTALLRRHGIECIGVEGRRQDAER
ncbi:MAG: DUF523 domain-containing protein, partial [Planctomycetota bacterium]